MGMPENLERAQVNFLFRISMTIVIAILLPFYAQKPLTKTASHVIWKFITCAYRFVSAHEILNNRKKGPLLGSLRIITR